MQAHLHLQVVDSPISLFSRPERPERVAWGRAEVYVTGKPENEDGSSGIDRFGRARSSLCRAGAELAGIQLMNGKALS